jgi:thiamine kinase-like enzyme
LAIYQYIEGERLASSKVVDSDIDQVVQFLTSLKELRNRRGSHQLPLASEACFSVQAIVDNIQLRLNRLSAPEIHRVPYQMLHEFLTNEFTPCFREITNWGKSRASLTGMSFDLDLPDEARTLSPSDFGFHNALKCSDGQLVFLDFEYFGWDDPAKMISDFLLHPAMALPESLKQRFVEEVFQCFGDDEYLRKRMEVVYPLFGLKWCLIFLNEFVPEHMLRRGFATGSDLSRSDIQAKQLSKARQMLDKIRSEYKQFPYD